MYILRGPIDLSIRLCVVLHSSLHKIRGNLGRGTLATPANISNNSCGLYDLISNVS
jgi:hypothetical protein